jgi:hypothetical protein
VADNSRGLTAVYRAESLPAKEAVHRAMISRVQAAQGERASAIAEVAVEVCDASAGQIAI